MNAPDPASTPMIRGPLIRLAILQGLRLVPGETSGRWSRLAVAVPWRGAHSIFTGPCTGGQRSVSCEGIRDRPRYPGGRCRNNGVQRHIDRVLASRDYGYRNQRREQRRHRCQRSPNHKPSPDTRTSAGASTPPPEWSATRPYSWMQYATAASLDSIHAAVDTECSFPQFR